MSKKKANKQPKDDEDIWQDILDGKRSPVEIIYIVKDLEDEHRGDIESIGQWGEYLGIYRIHQVETIDNAIELNKDIPSDIFVMYDGSAEEVEELASASPQTPVYLAQLAGYPGFDFSAYPPQVAIAGWVAPREHEFMQAVADALSKASTEIIWQATVNNFPKIELVTGVSQELFSRLARFPEERFKLNPRLFEETVAELLEKMGYTSKLTPRSGDKGRDVIAYYDTPTTPFLMLVECKRYAPHRLVTPEPITRLWYRMFDDHANMAMVVTTSGFQPVAKETAMNRGYQISLKDGNDFVKWINSLKLK